jgi:HD-GYP domain-containing protein (c-di-GMP phosphodiesterase class II)
MKRALSLSFSNIYILLVAFSTFPMLFLALNSIFSQDIPEIVFWIIIAILADMKPMLRYKKGTELSEVSMAFVVHLSIVFLMDTGKAIFIVLVSTLIVELISKKLLIKIFFNVGQYVISLFVSSYLFNLLKFSPNDVRLDIIRDFPAMVVSVCTYFLLNSALVSAVISLTAGIKFIEVFLSDFKELTNYFYTLALISIAVALIYNPNHPYVVFIMLPPVLIADQAIRRYFSLDQETQKTLNVLADAIDERDKYTAAHSKRVAEYSKRIARELGMHLEDIGDVEMSGRVHDLGKIGIKDKVLLKNSKLNDEEYSEIKKHSEISYKLLCNLKPYSNGAKYALYHHERYDGKGYPCGLSGDAIPLGARILAVADSYDAMTSDRPYRSALSQSYAIEELIRYSGSQFDPRVVDAFIKVLKKNDDNKET